MSAWIVAAAGPSLTQAVADRLHGHHIIAVNDAWRLIPFADVLYACDEKWWIHRAPKQFEGERWTSVSPQNEENGPLAQRLGLRFAQGRAEHGFSLEPNTIHHGTNSGFQAVNLAINIFKATHVVIVGMDMHNAENGDTHFFGHHEAPLVDPDPTFFDMSITDFNHAAETMPKHIRIVNATPGSALTCFPMLSLEEALFEIRHLQTQRQVRTA